MQFSANGDEINLLMIAYFNIFQITIHTDTLNESACVEQSIEAFKVNLLHVILHLKCI